MRKFVKLLFCTLIVAIILLFAGCSDGGSGSDPLSDKLATEDAIEAYITDRVTIECGYILEEVEEPISVLIVDGKAMIRIRVLFDFCIPSVAEELVPVAIDALAENDTELSEINISYYRTNNSGTVTGSMVSWRTRDGEKGTFASAPDNFAQVGYTISDLQEYYKDYNNIVEKLRNGED